MQLELKEFFLLKFGASLAWESPHGSLDYTFYLYM